MPGMSCGSESWGEVGGAIVICVTNSMKVPVSQVPACFIKTNPWVASEVVLCI